MPLLSTDQFEDQIAKRWGALNVTYHHVDNLMDPGPEHEARIRAWTRTEPAGRTTVGPGKVLHTDQASMEWDTPRSETSGPIHLVEGADNNHWIRDGGSPSPPGP
jgi:hypothetical protein